MYPELGMGYRQKIPARRCVEQTHNPRRYISICGGLDYPANEDDV